MVTISIRFDDMSKSVIPLGYVGENKHRRVLIDCKKMFEDYPTAVPVLAVIPPKGDPYPGTVTREGSTLLWDITDSDVVSAGNGKIQLAFTVDEIVAKSDECKTRIFPSCTPDGEIPTGIENWLIRAELLLTEIPAEIDAAIEEAKASGMFDGVGISSIGYVSTVGKVNTYRVNLTDGTHYDFAVNDGDDGVGISNIAKTGTAGLVDTYTITLTNNQTYTFTVTNGENGVQIDDDTPALNKVFSSSKVDDELTRVKNALQTLTPSATASDVGKFLKAKTVSNGKVTEYEFGEGGGGGSVDPSAIAQAVEDWCDENITSDPTVVIDTSLLVSGAAADSKAVGLKLKHNNDELKMQSSVDDFLAIATKHHDKKIDNSGAIVDGGNFDVYEIAYDETYSTFSATLYSNTNYLTKAIAFINANNEALDVIQFSNTSGASVYTNQTIPAGTAKILLCNKYSQGVASATYPTTHSKRIGDIETITSKADEAVERLSRNLLDETTFENGKGTNNSGKKSNVTGHKLSGFCAVEGSKYYVYQNAEASYSKFSIVFYTSADEDTFISGSKLGKVEKPFVAPATAHYCRIEDGTEATKQQLEEGEIKTDYHPYNYGTVKQENVIEDKIDIILPARVYAVANQEMNLYFANILEKDWTRYEIECECGNAAQLTRRLVWNNQAVEREFGIRVTKDKTTAERILELKITDASAMTHKSVLIIGDSTTSSNTVVEKLHADINNESLIDTIGTQGNAPYNHEGRSGWSISSYCSNTTGNPFWNPTSEKFDASYYFTQNNISFPDFFIIALGINDIFQISDSQFEDRMELLDGMVSSVKEASSNIGVCLSLVLPPHDQDAFGVDYPARYKNAITQYRKRWAKWNRLLIDTYDHRESEGIYVLPINMNLDTVYGMNRTEQFVNARSTLKELRSSSGSGVHPIDSGYWQIADVYWAFLCYMSSLET